MADTLQVVNWFLRQACPFRQGPAVDTFFPAYQATQRLRAIDDAAGRGDVYGDVCVTSVVYSKAGKGPGSGFRVSNAVAPAGGLADARRVCGGCPANALDASRGELAGCWGYLLDGPGDLEVDAALRSALARHGLQGAHAAAFPKTRPLWPGLWITSPLNAAQLSILATIAPDLAVDERRGRDVMQFRRACELSAASGIPLYVAMAPPGHTDFGLSTTFPHCPRCKMGTGERWQKQYSTRQTTCRCCGHVFVPAETASTEEDGYEPEDLERMLPPGEFAALAAEWHRRHGSDDPTWLDHIAASDPKRAFESLMAADRPAAPRRSPLRRLWHRLTGRG